jgi:hypothetical protein
MDQAEFAWWAAADDLGLLFDPILAVAQIRSTIANSQGASTTPATYLPSRPAPDADEMLARVMRDLPRMRPPTSG